MKGISKGYDNKQLAYDYTELLESPIWLSSSTKEIINVTIPRKSMKAIILPSKPTGSDGTENYEYPNIEKVNVSFEGRLDVCIQRWTKKGKPIRGSKIIFRRRCKMYGILQKQIHSDC